MPKAPELRIRLRPDGGLEMALPGALHVGDRWIPLRQTSTCNPGDTLRRTLQGIASDAMALGEDGAPTRAQVVHWERHHTYPDRRCPFCLAEDPTLRTYSAGSVSASWRKLGEGVQVRKVPPAPAGARRGDRPNALRVVASRLEADELF